jgi:MFS family permease
MLSVCSFQLIFGKLYTFLSIKWVYLVALFIFELGSFVCGIAPSSNALIVGRAVAGLGAAGLFSGAILIVSKSVPLHRRPTYVGLMGSMYGVASVVGPLYVVVLTLSSWSLLTALGQTWRSFHGQGHLAMVVSEPQSDCRLQQVMLTVQRHQLLYQPPVWSYHRHIHPLLLQQPWWTGCWPSSWLES